MQCKVPDCERQALPQLGKGNVCFKHLPPVPHRGRTWNEPANLAPSHAECSGRDDCVAGWSERHTDGGRWL